jgi:lipoate-protein ligase A
MRFIDITLPTLAENLALDEALLRAAETDRVEVLRLWEWPTYAVVLGAAGKLVDDVDVDACRRDNIPILRRSSGGGTVLLGAGCLLYTLVLSYERAAELTEVRPSYRYILGRVRDALAMSVPGLELAGISDLAVAGRKVSGNAQQRKRRCLLHHGTLLYAADVVAMSRYLRQPARQPEYRAGRAHGDFITNIDVPAETIKRLLREAWQAETAPEMPHETIRSLVADKYLTKTWSERR